MITFVIFHVDISQETAQAIVPFGTAFRTSYAQMLLMLIDSIKRFHPNAKIVVLSDTSTSFDYLPTHVAVMRFDLDTRKLMLARLDAQSRFLEADPESGPVVFIDSDMLVTSSLQDLFADDGFEIGLTYRPHPRMPINGGLILVQGGRRRPAQRFVRQVHDIAGRDFADSYPFVCDQLAITACLGNSCDVRQRVCTTTDGIRIHLWPCTTHNWSPANAFSEILQIDPRIRIVHFKGNLKRLMPLCYRAHIRQRRTDRAFASLAILARAGADAFRWRWQRLLRVSSPAQ